MLGGALGRSSQRFSRALNHAKSPRRWTSISSLDVTGIGTLVQGTEEMTDHDDDKDLKNPSTNANTSELCSHTLFIHSKNVWYALHRQYNG
jgi:hypothetical protein